MKTYLDCIPCFFKQALEASRIAGADTDTQRHILHDVARAIPRFSLEASPPEMGRIIYNVVKKHTNTEDPYEKIKEANNLLVLSVYDRILDHLNRSNDRLLTAVELAIAGNVIDCGVNDPERIDRELIKLISSKRKTYSNGNRDFFDYPEFRDSLNASHTILYLADNAGETVFDRILLEEIGKIDHTKDIIYAVKEKPIINDALEKDAIDCGIDGIARIVSSGSDAPGTIPSLCSDRFLRIYRNADIVISKGQGNFEGLSDTKRDVFFLLMAKCPVVARDIGCRVGDMILLHHAEERQSPP